MTELPQGYDPLEGTYTGARYDLIEPGMLDGIAKVLEEGARKYGEQSWRSHTSFSSDLNHALRHLCGVLQGDTPELMLEHLNHAATRIMFAHWHLCNDANITDHLIEP